jgi:hypothetical protein
MPRKIKQAINLGDGHVFRSVAGLDNLVAGANLAFFNHA